MSSEVPEGWSVKPLGEIADLIMGQSPPSSVVTEGGEGVPFIQGNAEFGTRHPAPRFVASITPKVAQTRDVLVSVRAPVGEVNIAEGPLCIGRGICGVRAKGCDPDFLFYAVGGLSKTFTRLSQGSTFDAINGKELRSIEILVPPLDEQRRIAEVLRSVDEAFATAVDASAQCLSARNAIIDQVLRSGMPRRGQGPSAAWVEARLGDVMSIKHGFAFSSDFFRSEDTGTILLTPGNFSVSKRLYFGSNTKFYDGPVPEGYILANGDLLVVMTDLTQDMAILGNAVTLDARERVLHNQRIGKVNCDPSRIVADFARLLLNSPGVQSRVKASASGSTVRHTSPGKILEIEVKLPSLEEQRDIVSFAHTLDQSVEREAMIAAPPMRGRARGALHEMTALLRMDLLSGRIRVPA